MEFLNLAETEEHISAVNTYIHNKYGNEEPGVPPLDTHDRRVIGQGLMLTRTEGVEQDNGIITYTTSSPNYPLPVWGEGDTRKAALESFYARVDAQRRDASGK
jgi:hypothetical protein